MRAGSVVPLFLCLLLASGCNFVTVAPAEYFKDHSEKVQAFDWVPAEVRAVQASGTILIPSQNTELIILLHNPRNLPFQADIRGDPGTWTYSVSITGYSEVRVLIENPVDMETKNISLYLKTDLRDFDPYLLRVKCDDTEISNAAKVGVQINGYRKYFDNLEGAISGVTGGSAANPVEVYVAENVTVASPIDLNPGTHVQLIPDGLGNKTITKGSTTGTLFTVGSGSSLTLGEPGMAGELILNGISSSSDTLLFINGGKLTMYEDVTVTNNTASAAGGGIRVENSGTFEMRGGKITSNSGTYGGGVRVWRGTFTMWDGEISGNQSGPSHSGGGVGIDDGTFTMKGGTIKNNTGATPMAAGYRQPEPLPWKAEKSVKMRLRKAAGCIFFLAYSP